MSDHAPPGGAPQLLPALTVLYILNWALDLALKSLSGPAAAGKGLVAWVISRKSVNRKPKSSLWLLALYSRPQCSSLRGPRQLVSELKMSCFK